MFARALALALLFAQSGALIHAGSHVSDEPGERQGIARSCSFCLASSQLQHAAGPPAHEMPARPPVRAAAAAAPDRPVPAASPFRAFRSRAPPSLV